MDERMCRAAAMLLCLLPAVGHADESDAEPRLGLAMNTIVDGEVSPVRLAPTALLLVGNSQLEAGVGLHPFIRTGQRIVSGELGYKYFPNGDDSVLSLYVLGRFSYVNNARETFYPTTYHYLFLNGGYGLVVSGQGRSYIATDVSAGPYTYIRRSDNPYPGFDADDLFDDVGLNLTFQCSIGYRF